MSAFAWLISFAPLSVGSGQCLVFFPRLLFSACSFRCAWRFSLTFPSKWRRGKVFRPSLAPSELLVGAHNGNLWSYSSATFKAIADRDNLSWRFLQNWSSKLRLLDGRPFVNKKNSSAFEVLCSSFGLVSAILRKKTGSKERGSAAINKVKEFLNGLDLSSLKGDGDDVNCERPRAARRLTIRGTQRQFSEEYQGHPTRI